jgi:5-formyltetrahydrofolate cyclo-ligase
MFRMTFAKSIKFMNKTQLRTAALAKRNSLTQYQIQNWSADICNKIIKSAEFQNAKVIHIYKSFRSEVQTNEIIQKAFDTKKIVLIPETLPDQTMRHWQISPSTTYSTEKFGILIPIANCELFDESKLDANDLVIVPLVAFDTSNNRIGYGMGCYDRFLKATKAVKIGLAFRIQQVEDFETDPWDIALDQIIQE